MLETVHGWLQASETRDIALAWSGFLVGYLIILAVPGPNMLIVSYVAATRGLKATLPLALAIGCGAACLFAIIHALADMIGPGFREGLTAVSVGLLFLSAFRIATSRLPNPAVEGRGDVVRYSDVTIGFACGFSNPVTAAYFVFAILGERNLLMAQGMGIPLVCSAAVLCSSFAMLAAAVFSRRTIQQQVMRRFTTIKVIAATLMASYGLTMAGRLLGPVLANLIGDITPLAQFSAVAQW
jgi:threonine/homoserine/homoserine lactone efflux protein